MPKTSLRLLPGLVLAFSGLASAASFQSWEQNASGLGTAYAGSAAVADNASTVFFNPAGLTQLEGIQFSTGLVASRSTIKFHDQGSSGPGLGTNDGGDAGKGIALPNLYFSTRVLPDLYFGFGVSRPLALSTEYDAGWVGQVQALKATLKTVNYNPSLAYKLNEKVSLGFGLDFQKLDVDLSAIGSRYKAHDSAPGWNAGALFTLSPAMRVGVAYRSAIKFKLEDQGLSVDLKTPDTLTLSVWQQVSDRWEAMGDLSYTNWSTVRVDSLSADSYRDAWRFAWGAAYKATDATKLKFGFAYDRSPTRGKDNHVAYAPDTDRLWLSLGGQWNAGSMGRIDLGYAYLMATRDARINQTTGINTTLRGEYDIGQHLLGLQYSVGF